MPRACLIRSGLAVIVGAIVLVAVIAGCGGGRECGSSGSWRSLRAVMRGEWFRWTG